MNEVLESLDQFPVGFENANVIVRGKADGFAQKIFMGPHRLAADEPIAAEAQIQVRRPMTCCSLRWVPVHQ